MQLDRLKQPLKRINQMKQMLLVIPHTKNDSLATAEPPHYRNIYEQNRQQVRQIRPVVITPPTIQFLANQVRRSTLKITPSSEDNEHKLPPIPSTKADEYEISDKSKEKPLKQASNFQQRESNSSKDNNPSENMPQLKQFQDGVKNLKLLSRSLSESKNFQKNRLGLKQKKIYKNNHPTKNFLASFKMAHIYYLEKQLGKDKVHLFSDINRLQKQNGITKKDFVDLYSILEFTDTFEKMFYTKQLFRNLMLSKSRIEHRKVHQKKLFNFEKAFKTKQFLRIE